MLKCFNAFQIVLTFASGPFIVAYLRTASFYGSTVAYYVGMAAYVVAFCAMVVAILSVIERD